MSIISRYLGFSFLKTWVMALACFIVLYTAIDFIEKIGDFLGKGLGLKTILLFFAAQLPKVTVLMAPVATLVAVMVSLTILARASEIVAFKAGGVSLYRLSAPILTAGLGICLAMFLLSDMVAPRTTVVANAIWLGQVRERLNTSTVVKDIWIKAVRQVQHLGSYDEADGRVSEVTLIFTDDEMNLARRLEAKTGQFLGGRLILREALDKTYSHDQRGGSRNFQVKQYDTLTLPDWPAPPPGLGRVDQSSEELSVAQLWRTINRLQAEGFGPVRQRVDLQFKFSFALLPLVMVVVGLPIGLWREKGSNIALGLAAGLLLSFIYLITMELARSLGYSGLLPPLVAAWLPNLVFFLFGAYLFSYVRQ